MMTEQIPVGSKWRSTDGVQFVILAVVVLEGHTWVHYRKNQEEHQEYSCYAESFLSRFHREP
jgi:hypothetical protein